MKKISNKLFLKRFLFSMFFALLIFSSFSTPALAFNPITSLINIWKNIVFSPPIVEVAPPAVVKAVTPPVTKPAVVSQPTQTIITQNTFNETTLLQALQKLLANPEIAAQLRGPQGSQGLPGTNGTNGINGGSASAPVFITQPNPGANYNGASFFSATNLSSNLLNTNTANVANNLNVTGSSTIGGDLTVTGNIVGDAISGTDITGTSLTVNGVPITGGNSSQWDDVTDGINYAGGNVGINTTTPTQKLDVNGALAIAGITVINSSGEWVGSSTGLTGPQGETGATGPQGIQGIQGATGAAGASPFLLNGNDAYYTVGNVGIGTTTPDYPLTVAGNALLQGNTYLGNSAALAPAMLGDDESDVTIYKTFTGNVAPDDYKSKSGLTIQVEDTASGPTSVDLSPLVVNGKLLGSGDYASDFDGMVASTLRAQSYGTVATRYMTGVIGQAYTHDSSQTYEAKGGWFYAGAVETSGIQNLYGIEAGIGSDTGSSVVNGYGIRIDPSDHTSIQNKYGLYIGEQSAGSVLNYNLFSAGANSTNIFEGSVGIGTTSPAYPLDVNGIVNATGLYVNGAPALGGAASLSIGTTAGTVAAGDDSRIVGAIQGTLVTSIGAPGLDTNIPTEKAVRDSLAGISFPGVLLKSTVDPGQPVVSLVQNQNSATPLVVGGSGVVAGDLLLVLTVSSNTPSDTVGSVWHSMGTLHNGWDTPLYAWYAFAASTGADSIAITGGAWGGNPGIMFTQLRGDFTQVVDASGTGVSRTASQANDLMIAWGNNGAGNGVHDNTTVTAPEVVYNANVCQFCMGGVAWKLYSQSGTITSSLVLPNGGNTATLAIKTSSTSVGNNGDWYLNTTTGVLWNKAEGSWSATSFALPTTILSTTASSVGIGTSTPSNILHVTGTPATGTAVTQISNTLSGTTQNNGLLILAGNNGGENASQMITFERTDATVIGSISQDSATTIAFNTSSDQRIKENIIPTAYGLSDLLKINVSDFTFINDPNQKKMTGFIAQELNTIYPGAVTTNGDNGTDTLSPGSTPWMIDYSKLTPLLVKSIQDLNLNLDGIAGTITPLKDSTNETFVTAFFTNLKTTIGTWLADAGNGIGDFFANRIHTKELCVAKSDGTEFCANGDQLQAVIGASSTPALAPTSTSAPVTQAIPDSNPITTPPAEPAPLLDQGGDVSSPPQEGGVLTPSEGGGDSSDSTPPAPTDETAQ